MISDKVSMLLHWSFLQIHWKSEQHKQQTELLRFDAPSLELSPNFLNFLFIFFMQYVSMLLHWSFLQIKEGVEKH